MMRMPPAPTSAGRLWPQLVVVLAALALLPLASARAQVDQSSQIIRLDQTVIRVNLPDETFAVGRESVLKWVERSASIVRGYYGFFPARALDIRLRAIGGSAVRGGQAAYGGRTIRVGVGREVTEAALLHDWVLVHEMIHLALPDVSETHNWLSEGLATYVEGIARTQAGNMTPDELWEEYRREMPKGLPDAGDRGLDRTHTWARTYWGGALFCLVADLEIHERSANRFGLQDALRAITRESGGMTTEWPITRVLATGDAATGTHVLQDLYASWKDRAETPDMADLWRRLGLEEQSRSVSPSSVGVAITRPHAGAMAGSAETHRP